MRLGARLNAIPPAMRRRVPIRGSRAGGRTPRCTGRDARRARGQFPIAAFADVDPTRQMALPTSSATSKLPARSIATPTGRPNASPIRVEAGEDIHRLSGRAPGGERHEDDLIAAARLAIPRPVLPDECPVPVSLRQRCPLGEREPQRGRVAAERIVGDDRLGHQVRSLRLDPGVHVLSVIAERPSVEATVLHRGQVVGHEIAAEFVPLVHHRPQHAGFRLPGHSVGIAQARGKHPGLPGGRIDFQNGRAAILLVQSVLGRVAVGPDGRIEMRPVRAGDDVLGPVMVDGTGRKVRDLYAWRVISVSPSTYGKRKIASVLAT